MARRLDDFDEFAADGHHNVDEAELRDAGIAIADLQPQHFLQQRLHRREILGDEGDLAKPHG